MRIISLADMHHLWLPARVIWRNVKHLNFTITLWQFFGKNLGLDSLFEALSLICFSEISRDFMVFVQMTIDQFKYARYLSGMRYRYATVKYGDIHCSHGQTFRKWNYLFECVNKKINTKFKTGNFPYLGCQMKHSAFLQILVIENSVQCRITIIVWNDILTVFEYNKSLRLFIILHAKLDCTHIQTEIISSLLVQ